MTTDNFCGNCGQPLVPGLLYCNNCGEMVSIPTDDESRPERTREHARKASAASASSSTPQQAEQPANASTSWSESTVEPELAYTAEPTFSPEPVFTQEPIASQPNFTSEPNFAPQQEESTYKAPASERSASPSSGFSSHQATTASTANKRAKRPPINAANLGDSFNKAAARVASSAATSTEHGKKQDTASPAKEDQEPTSYVQLIVGILMIIAAIVLVFVLGGALLSGIGSLFTRFGGPIAIIVVALLVVRHFTKG